VFVRWGDGRRVHPSLEAGRAGRRLSSERIESPPTSPAGRPPRLASLGMGLEAHPFVSRAISPSVRRPQLDGVRGLAILLVLVAHVVGLNGAGLAGVLLFFVLSGYLITSLLLREHEDRGRLDFRAFFVRRGLRLLPALVAFLVLYLVAVSTGRFGTSFKEATRGVALGLLYLTDFALGLGRGWVPDLAHLWSLAVEEHFYLLWPVALSMLLLRNGARGLLRPVVLLICLGAGLRVGSVAFALLAHPLYIYALPTTWIDSLLTGAVLAVIMRSGRAGALRQLAGRPVVMWGALGTVVLYAAWPGVDITLFTYVLGMPLLNAAGAILICGVELPGGGALRRVAGSSGLRWLGIHSYGLYLYNSTCIMLARHSLGHGLGNRFLGLGIALALASLSYAFVERPALRLKDRWGRPTVRSS